MKEECLACKFDIDECSIRKGGFCAGCSLHTKLRHVALDGAPWCCSDRCAGIIADRQRDQILTAQSIAAWAMRVPASWTPTEVANAILRGEWRK